MPKANAEHALLLYRAMASTLGLAVPVQDYAAAAQALYKTRSALADAELKILQFRRSPINPDGELWIVRSESHGKEVSASGP